MSIQIETKWVTRAYELRDQQFVPVNQDVTTNDIVKIKNAYKSSFRYLNDESYRFVLLILINESY